jgi:teichuronic acid biosynthesis glycosyltransferase TuaC
MNMIIYIKRLKQSKSLAKESWGATLSSQSNQAAIRVISVIPGDGKGSSMIFCRRLNEAVEGRGVDVVTFYLRSRTSPFFIYKEMKRFGEIADKFKPDIIHAQYGTVTSFFCAIVSAVPLVVTFRGSDLNPSPSSNWFATKLKTFLSQLSAYKAKTSICVSSGLANRLYLGKDRITVIPSGVDTGTFKPRPKEEARGYLGWSGEPVVLFYGGRFPKVKRLDVALEVMLIVKKSIDNVRMFNMDGNIDPQKVPYYMSASDCFLMTSDYEGSPTVIQEAKACNLPVVSVPVGDAEAQLKNVSYSRIVPRDNKFIAEALINILTTQKRSNGSCHLKGFSLDDVGEKVVEIYKKSMDFNSGCK